MADDENAEEREPLRFPPELIGDFDDLVARQNFLDRVSAGVPPRLAAIEVGWTPGRLRNLMKDRGWAILVEEAGMLVNDSVEAVLVEKALKGYEWAVKLWLFNRQPDRWREQKHVKVESTEDVSPSVIAATREAVREGILAAVMGGREGVATVQRAAIEARVVDDVG